MANYANTPYFEIKIVSMSITEHNDVVFSYFNFTFKRRK
jgi:hypothetical protein